MKEQSPMKYPTAEDLPPTQIVKTGPDEVPYQSSQEARLSTSRKGQEQAPDKNEDSGPTMQK